METKDLEAELRHCKNGKDMLIRSLAAAMDDHQEIMAALWEILIRADQCLERFEDNASKGIGSVAACDGAAAVVDIILDVCKRFEESK